MRKYITFLVLLLLFPQVGKALDCSHQTISEYAKVLSNVTYSYSYKETNNKVNFKITLLNVPVNFYVRDDYHNKYYFSSGRDMEFTSFPANATYKFEVLPDINACSDIEPRYIYVTLPGYNPYYNGPICKGVANYQYCNRWFQNNLKYKDFVTQVSNYKAKNASLKTEEKVIIADNTSYILNFYTRYYMFILPTIIIVLLGYIIYHNRRDNSLISVK